MSYRDIQGQTLAISQLQTMSEAGRVPSALMFLGPQNVGRRTTAHALAQALNCIQGPREGCGICPSCRKIQEGVHPDVIEVSPDGQFIKIDQIREISRRVSLVPYEAKKRVVILTAAEAMNPQAANAFLKTLEEPPQDTLLVLCAEGTSRLPETIVSRCMLVRFSPLSPKIVEELLAEKSKLSHEELVFATQFAQGRLRPELSDHVGPWMVLRDDIIQTFGRLDEQAFGEVTEKCTKWASSEDWRFVLGWLETWFHDLVLLGHGQTGRGLINADREEALYQWARRFNPRVAGKSYRRVLATRQAILLNANKTLALESLWLDIRVFARENHLGRSVAKREPQGGLHGSGQKESSITMGGRP